MNGVEVLQRVKCNDLAQLIDCLSRISKDSLESVPDYYATINDGGVVVSLERQTLTDGSEVYNVNIE